MKIYGQCYDFQTNFSVSLDFDFMNVAIIATLTFIGNSGIIYPTNGNKSVIELLLQLINKQNY